MGLSNLIASLYKYTLGGTNPPRTASSTGDISQMVKYLIANPPSAAMKVTGSGYLVMPASAGGIDPANSGAAWTSGAWSQVLASTSEADSVVGFIWEGEQASQDAFEGEIDIGTGGAGSETVVATLPVIQVAGAASSLAGDNINNPVFFPAVIEVANATRVAVRQRSSSTTREARNIRLIYVKKTELVSR